MNESIGTGTNCPNYCPVEIVQESVMERHLREELRIANAHLLTARRELREMQEKYDSLRKGCQ
jgi:hypothetical protein